MHTHTLQEYQLKHRDGNGTSKLNIGVLVACLDMWQIHGCTQRRLCDGLPGLAPMFSATDSELHVHHSNRYSAYLCLHPIKQQWFILAIHGDKLSDAITQNHLPPVCFVTTQHLKHTRQGGRDVRYEFGKARELGLFIVFLGQGEHVHMPFILLCRFLFNLDIWIYIIYILPWTSRFWLIVIKLLSKP